MFSVLRQPPRRHSRLPLRLNPAARSESSSTTPKNNAVAKDKDKDKDKADEDGPPLALLQSPLGVRERPSTHEVTRTDRFRELMDQDKRMAQRRHLLREAGKGYYTDLNRTRRHGGKTWIAPPTVIREDKALYFPDIAGTTLDNRPKTHTTDLLSGRISVVGIISSKISEIQVKAFTHPTNSHFFPEATLDPTADSPPPSPSSDPKRHPLYNHLIINLQENLLKSMLVSLFLSSIRRNVPPALHPTYLVSNQNLEYVHDDLGLVNRHIGYVYLVDEECRVRWAGCGDPMEQEREALVKCTKVLLDRLGKTKEGAVA